MERISYRTGYKYQLVDDYVTTIEIRPPSAASNRFVRLDPDGTLTIRADYAWDGPSGPTFDTPSFMRGSLVHDALYQLMRDGQLDKRYRNAADRVLRRICAEDGMPAPRRWWVYQAVRLFGGPDADPAAAHVAESAP